MTTRRGFLGLLAGFSVSHLLPPALPEAHPMIGEIVIGEYADYVNESDLVFVGYVHPLVVADLLKEGFDL